MSLAKGGGAAAEAEWVEYGRKLAEKDAEQRRRIREVCGEGGKRVQDVVAKYEEEEFQGYLEQRREQLLEQPGGGSGCARRRRRR